MVSVIISEIINSCIQRLTNISVVSGTSSIPTTSSASSKASTSSSTQSSTSTGPLPSWTGTPAVNKTIGSWEYLGCGLEVSGRALAQSSYSDGAAMTIESCQAFCTMNNYALAGLEYSYQCYCANTIATDSALGQTGCNMACSGNAAETCGGSNRLSIFNNTAYIYPGNPKTVNSYTYLGCYQEVTTGRLLSGASYTDTVAMTAESCTAFCKANVPTGGYAGVEYASQCYCGATLSQTPVVEPASSCNMLCVGNDKEYCGAGGMLNVYQYEASAVKKLRSRAIF